MATTLQIRSVPDDVHRELKARAAREGRSLSEYALAILRETLAYPPMGDALADIEADEPFPIRRGAAALVRAERDRR